MAADFSIALFPEHAQSFLLFSQLQTQWRVGPRGFYGLDYNVMFHKLDRMQLSIERFDEIESDIRIMEDAALTEMGKGRK